MKNANDEISSVEQLPPPVVVALGATDFQVKVLEKWERLEAKMDMIVGNVQPGRITLAEERVVALGKK